MKFPLAAPWCTLYTSQVWASEALREQFLALPLPAVRCLLASEATCVAAENTALVALAGWVEEGAAGQAATPAQRKELVSLVSEILGSKEVSRLSGWLVPRVLGCLVANGLGFCRWCGCLLASEATCVAAKNIALVALAGCVEEGAAGQAASPAQRKELLSLVSGLQGLQGL